MNFELIFSVLFLVLRIYSRGSRYFFGCHIRRLWRYGEISNFAEFLFWILGIITEIRFECRDAWSNRWSSI